MHVQRMLFHTANKMPKWPGARDCGLPWLTLYGKLTEKAWGQCRKCERWIPILEFSWPNVLSFETKGNLAICLKVGKEFFPAHCNVLASYSDYFYTMFADGMKELNQEVIELNDESLSPHVFKVVMDCIYSGDLQINKENVFEVLSAADSSSSEKCSSTMWFLVDWNYSVSSIWCTDVSTRLGNYRQTQP